MGSIFSLLVFLVFEVFRALYMESICLYIYHFALRRINDYLCVSYMARISF